MTDGAVYCEAMEFTVKDTNLKEVTVDDASVDLKDGSYTIAASSESEKEGSEGRTHTIVATDKAGNETTVNITVYNGHVYGEPVFTWLADYSKATAVFTCEHDKSHTESVDAGVKSETIDATENAEGKIVYTASVPSASGGELYTDTKTKTITAVGSVDAGDGKITTEIIVFEDMPKTEIDKITEDAAKELLGEDYENVEKGAKVKIYLEANKLEADAVTAEDKNSVEGQLDDVIKEFANSQSISKGKSGNGKVRISWASYKGADGYDCYWSYCDGDSIYSKVKSASRSNEERKNDKCKENYGKQSKSYTESRSNKSFVATALSD